MWNTVKIADRGGADIWCARWDHAARQGHADDQAWLAGVRDRPLYILRVRFGGAAPREKETKHAMVRFLATPGVAPGGGTL